MKGVLQKFIISLSKAIKLKIPLLWTKYNKIIPLPQICAIIEVERWEGLLILALWCIKFPFK